MSSTNPRADLVEARRVVVKIGTKSILGGAGGRFSAVARQVAALHGAGKQVVLVSSGAIGMGFPRLGLPERPTQIAELQASAAAGQSRLMHAWEEAFSAFGIEVAQVLLTQSGIADRSRYLNARGALDALLGYGCVPVVNENDTVAVDEIRFGDNDQLAALVAALVGADLLVLLTDVEGLLDESGARVSLIADPDEAKKWVRPHADNGFSLGGMESKLAAAQLASLRGLPVVMADARAPEVLSEVLAGADVGTLVLPHGSPLASRKHWIAYTLKPQGSLLLDAGAVRAVREGKGSLLPAGVVGVRGDFAPGDPVSLVSLDGEEVARGLCRYGVHEVARVAGAQAIEVAAVLGRPTSGDVVHRDDLVVL